MVEHSLRNNQCLALGQLFLHSLDPPLHEPCREVFLGSRSFMLSMYNPHIRMYNEPKTILRRRVGMERWVWKGGCNGLVTAYTDHSSLSDFTRFNPHLYPV